MFDAENFMCRLSWCILGALLVLSSGISLQFTLEMWAAAKNSEKFTKNSSFGGSGSFTFIDVDKTKKPLSSACYDRQFVCTYLQPFSH